MQIIFVLVSQEGLKNYTETSNSESTKLASEYHRENVNEEE